MPQKFYVGDYGGPLSINVFAADGITPILPVSATIDIINMVTGSTIVNDGVCIVLSGIASYVIPQSSPATSGSGKYVGYMTVLIETGNQQTEEVYYNVYEKTSYLILERWRAKVLDSALDADHTDDDAAREWIDQAVGWINKRIDLGYTSVLGALTPLPNDKDMEFIASVGALMARTAWWAGKGNWHDDEMSFDGSPFAAEWSRLENAIEVAMQNDWYSDSTSGDMYNRDDVYFDGIKYDSPLYWHYDPDDVVPTTNIPVP